MAGISVYGLLVIFAFIGLVDLTLLVIAGFLINNKLKKLAEHKKS